MRRVRRLAATPGVRGFCCTGRRLGNAHWGPRKGVVADEEEESLSDRFFKARGTVRKAAVSLFRGKSGGQDVSRARKEMDHLSAEEREAVTDEMRAAMNKEFNKAVASQMPNHTMAMVYLQRWQVRENYYLRMVEQYRTAGGGLLARWLFHPVFVWYYRVRLTLNRLITRRVQAVGMINGLGIGLCAVVVFCSYQEMRDLSHTGGPLGQGLADGTVFGRFDRFGVPGRNSHIIDVRLGRLEDMDRLDEGWTNEYRGWAQFMMPNIARRWAPWDDHLLVHYEELAQKNDKLRQLPKYDITDTINFSQHYRAGSTGK